MRVTKIAGALTLVALLAATWPSIGLAAPAAQANLLVNPSFEEPYTDSGRQANGWGRWFEDTGKAAGGSLDYVVRPSFSAETNLVLVHGGFASQHVGNRYDPWHACVKQAVAVPANTRVRFCAFGRLFANNEDFEKAPSVSSINGRMQVGIFTNGDAEWNTGGIVWSGEANPHNAWKEICVEATVGDQGKVTVFVSANYRGGSAYHLDAWWDDATLVAVTPPATTAPTAPPRPTAAPIACETRADGSVIRVVQSGDTIGAIAIACDSTIDDIRRLNNITSDLISVGQTLIVIGPTVPPTATPAPTPIATATPLPSPTPGDGEICVEAFNDANASQSKDTGEQLLAGVGFTLSDATGLKGSYVTSGLEPEPYCFAGLQPGAYTVDAKPPLGVNHTTDAQWPVGVTAGMQFSIAYGGSREASGSVPSGAGPTQAPASGDAGSAAPSGEQPASNLGRIVMGGLGVIVLLAAGFMAGLVITRARR